MTEGRTCPLPFSCHSQHTLVFTFSGNSSGSVSSQASPSRFPSGIIKACSTLQLRDSAGFAPAYLLSINTPDTLLFSFSLIRFLNFIAIYHAVFAVPQRKKHLHEKLSKLLIMYIGFFLILQ